MNEMQNKLCKHELIKIYRRGLGSDVIANPNMPSARKSGQADKGFGS